MEEIKIYSIKDGLIKADMLNQQGKYDVALEIYDMLIEMQEDCIPAYNNKAFVYEKMGEYEKALSAYSKVSELKPADGYIYVSIGNIYENQGDYKKALDAYYAEWGVK